MKLIRFSHKSSGLSSYGVIRGNKVIHINNYLERKEFGESDLSEINILTPAIPSKIVAIGLNYLNHADELNFKLPDEPLIFLKPPSSAIAHMDKIVYPEGVTRLDYEAELAVVISKTCKNISEKEADEFVLGYTALNDVTARDLQAKDGQWTRAKGFDTFSPFGPTIETELDTTNLRIQSVLNDSVKQDARTSDMIFSIPKLISFVSRVMTLFPGDIISTGTPSGIGPMLRNDKIEIRIEGLDSLINTVE